MIYHLAVVAWCTVAVVDVFTVAQTVTSINCTGISVITAGVDSSAHVGCDDGRTVAGGGVTFESVVTFGRVVDTSRGDVTRVYSAQVVIGTFDRCECTSVGDVTRV